MNANQAPTAFSVPTASCGVRSQPQNAPEAAPAQAPSAANPQGLPDSSDKWSVLEFFAKRTTDASAIEFEIAQVFERRRTVSRRLADAAKRRDEQMAAEGAKQWLDTSIKLVGLFEKYAPIMQENEKILRELRAMGR